MRTRTLEENPSRVESELCDMKRETDKLRNAVKDKVVENLDEMMRRTD